MFDDYATIYHALTKVDSVYTHVTQKRPVEYLASYFVRNEILASLMCQSILKMIKWMFYSSLSQLCEFIQFFLGLVFDGCVLFAPFGIPTPKFRATCIRWWSRIFLFVVFLLLLFLIKPYLSNRPIKPRFDLGLERHRFWKTVAEHKRLWHRINQTQIQIDRAHIRLQTELKSLHEKLDRVNTWGVSSMVSEHLDLLNASVEQKIQNTVRKSLNSVLVEIFNGKVILSSRLISLFQDKKTFKEISHYLKKFTEPRLVDALNHVIVLKIGEVQSMIDKQIAKYHQDYLNRADFALLSRGGRIIYHSPSYRSPMLQIFSADQAQAVIQPGHYAGKGWSMKGSSGTITISLSETIQIDGISVEYPSYEMMMPMMNAPKDILVYANLFTNHWQCIAKVQYSIQGPSIQTFHISNPDALSFRKVLINITSNWGNEAYTDIYRIRIHGKPMSN